MNMQLRQLLLGDEAATAVEYAVLLALILLAMIGSIAAFGTNLGGLFTTMDGDLQTHGLGGS